MKVFLLSLILIFTASNGQRSADLKILRDAEYKTIQECAEAYQDIAKKFYDVLITNGASQIEIFGSCAEHTNL